MKSQNFKNHQTSHSWPNYKTSSCDILPFFFNVPSLGYPNSRPLLPPRAPWCSNRCARHFGGALGAPKWGPAPVRSTDPLLAEILAVETSTRQNRPPHWRTSIFGGEWTTFRKCHLIISYKQNIHTLYIFMPYVCHNTWPRTDAMTPSLMPRGRVFRPKNASKDRRLSVRRANFLGVLRLRFLRWLLPLQGRLRAAVFETKNHYSRSAVTEH